MNEHGGNFIDNCLRRFVHNSQTQNTPAVRELDAEGAPRYNGPCCLPESDLGWRQTASAHLVADFRQLENARWNPTDSVQIATNRLSRVRGDA